MEISPEKFSPEEKTREQQLYEKLQQERALERHEEALKRQIKGIKGESLHLEQHKKRREEIADFVERKEFLTKEVETKAGLAEIQDREKEIEEEVLKTAKAPEEIAQMKTDSWKRLVAFIRKRQKGLKLFEASQSDLEKFSKDVFEKPSEEFTSEIYSEIEQWKDENKNLQAYLEEELANENPESFMAHWLLKLRQYQRELPSGIVETAYPKEQKERAKDTLLKNKLIALLGETGTGKTRLARKIAQELTEEYEFVAGHSFMTKEDLFSYLGIAVEKVSPEETPKLITEAINRYYLLNPEAEKLDIAKKEKIERWIEEVTKGQITQPKMKTEVFEAAVLIAAKEGRIVIIDEFNYIPTNLLAGFNALTEAKPGEKVNVFGQEIEVKEGFGVILTGNITKQEAEGEIKKIKEYLKREKLDLALVNRLNSGLIEYISLPQEVSLSFGESILAREDLEKGAEILERELFQIALTLLCDKKGNLSGPKDTLEKAWNLSRELSLFQKLFAGEGIKTEVKLPGGLTPQFVEYPVSNRTFRSIIEGWRKEGFKYSLDWYIYDNLIRPAAVIATSEATQMWVLLKERGGFFQDPAWQKIQTDLATYKLTGVDEIERKRREFKKSLELKEPAYYFSPREIGEAMAGVRMPALKPEEYKIEVLERERMEKYQELKEKIEETEKFIEEWEQTIELFCEDEKNIYREEK